MSAGPAKGRKTARKGAGKTPAAVGKKGASRSAKGKKAGKGQLKIPVAELRSLSANGGSMAEVAAGLGTSADALNKAIGGSKNLAVAWDRGRLLYGVGPASYGASIEETAAALGMSAAELRGLLAADTELRDHRRQLQLRLLRSATAALISEAVPAKTDDGPRKAPNIAALRELLGRISADVAGEKRVPDFSALPVGQATVALGTTRETLSQWTKKGAPRNADRSVNLPAVIKWREGQLGARAARGGGGASTEEQLRRERIEKLRIENEAKRGQLLPRGDVILGLLARHQVLRRAAYSRPAVLAEVLQGQPAAKIRQSVEKEFADVLREIIGMPLELQLSKQQQAVLHELEVELSEGAPRRGAEK